MLAEQPAGHVTTPVMPARPLCMIGDTNLCPVVSELRERVEALEWLCEVEQVHYTAFWTKEAKQEWRVTLAHARKEAGV